MRLIDNASELLTQKERKDQPMFYKDWWVMEEGDLDYPEAHSLLDSTPSECHYWGQQLKTKYGFFRKRNSKEDLLKQEDILKRFPLKAIVRLAYRWETLRLWKVYEENALEILETYSGKTNEELIKLLSKEEN